MSMEADHEAFEESTDLPETEGVALPWDAIAPSLDPHGQVLEPLGDAGEKPALMMADDEEAGETISPAVFVRAQMAGMETEDDSQEPLEPEMAAAGRMIESQAGELSTPKMMPVQAELPAGAMVRPEGHRKPVELAGSAKKLQLDIASVLADAAAQVSLDATRPAFVPVVGKSQSKVQAVRAGATEQADSQVNSQALSQANSPSDAPVEIVASAASLDEEQSPVVTSASAAIAKAQDQALAGASVAELVSDPTGNQPVIFSTGGRQGLMVVTGNAPMAGAGALIAGAVKVGPEPVQANEPVDIAIASPDGVVATLAVAETAMALSDNDTTREIGDPGMANPEPSVIVPAGAVAESEAITHAVQKNAAAESAEMIEGNDAVDTAEEAPTESPVILIAAAEAAVAEAEVMDSLAEVSAEVNQAIEAEEAIAIQATTDEPAEIVAAEDEAEGLNPADANVAAEAIDPSTESVAEIEAIEDAEGVSLADGTDVADPAEISGAAEMADAAMVSDETDQPAVIVDEVPAIDPVAAVAALAIAPEPMMTVVNEPAEVIAADEIAQDDAELVSAEARESVEMTAGSLAEDEAQDQAQWNAEPAVVGQSSDEGVEAVAADAEESSQETPAAQMFTWTPAPVAYEQVEGTAFDAQGVEVEGDPVASEEVASYETDYRQALEDQVDPEDEREFVEEFFTPDGDEGELVGAGVGYDEDSNPNRTVSGIWTIPLLCAGMALIACTLLIPAADTNRRLAHERERLRLDLDQMQRQITVNSQFLDDLKKDATLAQRIAQRQMRVVPQGMEVIPTSSLAGAEQVRSPFAMVTVPPAPVLPEYRPVGGLLSNLCRDPKHQVWLIGTGLMMVAVGLVCGSSESPPQSKTTPEDMTPTDGPMPADDDQKDHSDSHRAAA